MTEIVIYDRVKFTGYCTGGIGTLILSSGVTGFLQPNQVGAAEGLLWPFLIMDETLNEWEVGLYQEQTNFNTSWDRSGGQTILASSNSGSAVNFTNQTAGDLTISLVDPSVIANPGMLELNTGDGTILRATAWTPLTYPLYFPCVQWQYARNAIEAFFGPDGKSHVEKSMSRVQTTTDTPANVATFNFPTTTGAGFLSARILALNLTGAGPYTQKVMQLELAVRDTGGANLEILGTPTLTTVGEDAGMSAATVTWSVSTNQLQVVVTGLAANTIDWVCESRLTYAAS